MTPSSRSILYWAPRVLAIAFIVFLSLFSLDVFNEGLDALGTISALTIHLLPAIALALLLAIAWRREWIGTLCFGLAGAYYIWTVAHRPDLSVATRFSWGATIAGPSLLIAILFWTSWMMRRRPASG